MTDNVNSPLLFDHELPGLDVAVLDRNVEHEREVGERMRNHFHDPGFRIARAGHSGVRL